MKEKGYSLLEVLTCLVIITISSLTLQKGYGALERLKMKQTATELQALVKRVQQTAGLKNQYYKLIASTQQDAVYVIHGITVIESLEIPDPLLCVISSKDNLQTAKEISFNKSLVPSTTATITLRHPVLKTQLQLTVAPVTGKVRAYESSY
jgi:prepilin-type N-terminal cleavage/methylation domain-containing protein